MQVQPQKYTGLVADLLPLFKLMRYFGHFLYKYTPGAPLIKLLYALVTFLICITQFFFLVLNMLHDADEINELTANTITVFFFVQSFIKLLYCGLNRRMFYK